MRVNDKPSFLIGEIGQITLNEHRKAGLSSPYLNLRSFGSKCTVLNKVLVTLLGIFGAPAVIWHLGNCAPLSPPTLHPCPQGRYMSWIFIVVSSFWYHSSSQVCIEWKSGCSAKITLYPSCDAHGSCVILNINFQIRLFRMTYPG